MGLLSRLGLTKASFGGLSSPVDLGIASPWQEGALSPVAISDIFPEAVVDKLPLSRAQAIEIPAVSKARNLLVGTVMRFPLVALKSKTSDLVDPQPTFLYRTNMGVSPPDRMAWTIDDCIFHGYSLWVVERGANDQITSAAWIPISRWTITNGNILIDEKPVSNEQVLLFNPPFEGLLSIANRTMRGARSIEQSWVSRVKNPIPLVELRITDDSNITQEEANEYVASWTAKHNSDNASVGLTPPGMELKDHGAADPQMYVEARNAIRTDVGSFLNVRASMLDGTQGIDSLTYSTTEGEKNSFYEFDMPFWTIPIESRLSQDDVVPAGQRVRFDKYAQYGAPIDTDIPTED